MKRVNLLMLSAFFTLIAGAQDGGGADIKVDINKAAKALVGTPIQLCGLLALRFLFYYWWLVAWQKRLR
jgi:hypothetical protein